MTNPDPISVFDGKTISYTYDNGWSFTNTFDGHMRISRVPRDELREHVEMIELRDEPRTQILTGRLTGRRE